VRLIYIPTVVEYLHRGAAACRFFIFQWTEEIIEHLAEHDVLPDEFERIVQTSATRSQCIDRPPTALGYGDDGRLLYCVYELMDEITVLPVTAFEKGKGTTMKKTAKKARSRPPSHPP